MKNIRKYFLMLLIFVLISNFVGCKKDSYREDDNLYVGTYYGVENEEDKMTISYNGDSYKIELQLLKYGDISCVGVSEEYELKYTGKNSDDDFFYGSLEYEGDGRVEFEIWTEDYLSEYFRDEDDFFETYFQKDSDESNYEVNTESEYESINNTEDEVYDSEYIMDKLQGFWYLTDSPYNSRDFVSFDGEDYVLATYNSEVWEQGKIDDVTENDDGSVTLHIFCPDIIIADEVVNPEHTTIIKVSSEDDFTRTANFEYKNSNENSNKVLTFVYAGATMEEFTQLMG